MSFTVSEGGFEALAVAIAEIFDISDGERPTEIRGFRRKNGRIYRFDAFYPNHWRLRVNLNGKGEVTSYSGHLRMTSERGAK